MLHILLALRLLTSLSLTRAQLPPQAHCNASSQYAWLNNSLGQDPCTVASVLGGVCSPTGILSIRPLSSGEVYSGPSQNQSDDSCLCSSVYFSMLSACSFCQGFNSLRWSIYTQNCTRVYLEYFAENIPSGTKVAHWAYDDVTTWDGFNATVAQSESDLPESSGSSAPTTTASSTPTTRPVSRASHAGTIAGGVIGGFVGLALILGAVFTFIRRRRRPRAPSQLYNSSNAVDPFPAFRGTSPVYTTPKLYDPSDPSTFPPISDVTSSMHNSATPQEASPHGMHSVSHPLYTGAPEV